MYVLAKAIEFVNRKAGKGYYDFSIFQDVRVEVYEGKGKVFLMIYKLFYR